MVPVNPTDPVGQRDPVSLALALPPTAETKLSLAEVRMLLRALLPLPTFDLEAALALLSYQQRRKVASYRSHRKRKIRRLDELRQQASL
jgi:hypothetical protein